MSGKHKKLKKLKPPADASGLQPVVKAEFVSKSKIESKLTDLRTAILMAVTGITVFFSGLKSPFMGDDMSQIVNNIPVHSIANIGTFFNGSTFFTGTGQPLTGFYYRPLM